METTISLEGLITIAISVLGGVIWLLSLVFGLRSEVKSLNKQVEDLKSGCDKQAEDLKSRCDKQVDDLKRGYEKSSVRLEHLWHNTLTSKDVEEIVKETLENKKAEQEEEDLQKGLLL